MKWYRSVPAVTNESTAEPVTMAEVYVKNNGATLPAANTKVGSTVAVGATDVAPTVTVTVTFSIDNGAADGVIDIVVDVDTNVAIGTLLRPNVLGVPTTSGSLFVINEN